jgi:hypothetical protein
MPESIVKYMLKEFGDVDTVLLCLSYKFFINFDVGFFGSCVCGCLFVDLISTLQLSTITVVPTMLLHTFIH